jgi:hypothetical protein
MTPKFSWDKQNEGHLKRHGIIRSEAEDVLAGKSPPFGVPDGGE